MFFAPHTDRERQDMLNTIGISAIDELFANIPERHRFPDLDLPQPLSELELAAALREISQRNRTLAGTPSFLGAGVYHHFVPATVDYVLQRGEFYTSYTPYQPELSQGILQAMFEYQTMICRLTGMDVSNASHYDGATSLAEAVLLALDAAGSRRPRVVVSPSVHPHYGQVLATYLRGIDAELVIPNDLSLTANQLVDLVDDRTAAFVIQTPNFFGRLEDLNGVATAVHAKGALLTTVVDPISLGLFRPPGEFGADIVVADGQPLGIKPSFGGPSVGIFATRHAHIRQLSGRLVGQTVDAEGKRGYVLTLATREQHIRRARATSNICTNSALGALAAATYLATIGNHGLRRVAEFCFHKSHYAAAEIGKLSGTTVNPGSPDAPFFKEFVVSLPRTVREVNQILLDKHQIIGGFDLGQIYFGQNCQMLIAVTEMNTRAEIDRLVNGLRDATS